MTQLVIVEGLGEGDQFFFFKFNINSKGTFSLQRPDVTLIQSIPDLILVVCPDKLIFTNVLQVVKRSHIKLLVQIFP